jgi:hypothetical protein
VNRHQALKFASRALLESGEAYTADAATLLEQLADEQPAEALHVELPPPPATRRAWASRGLYNGAAVVEAGYAGSLIVTIPGSVERRDALVVLRARLLDALADVEALIGDCDPPPAAEHEFAERVARITAPQ